MSQPKYLIVPKFIRMDFLKYWVLNWILKDFGKKNSHKWILDTDRVGVVVATKYVTLIYVLKNSFIYLKYNILLWKHSHQGGIS